MIRASHHGLRKGIYGKKKAYIRHSRIGIREAMSLIVGRLLDFTA